MKCIFCGSNLHKSDICPNCGHNLKTINRLKDLSNYYYNLALDYANVNSLSKAIVELQNAIAINKNNIKAINLLGLCYYQIGEFTLAFREWIYSLNIDDTNNLASKYLSEIENDKQLMKDINNCIRLYNKALDSITDSNEKVAVFQLQKVVNKMPNMIQATSLLVLLKIELKEYKDAEKLANKILVYDYENELALKYLTEINKTTTRNMMRLQLTSVDGIKESKEESIGNSLFKEYSLGRTITDIVIGLVLGILVMLFLVFPAIKDNQNTGSKNVVLKQGKTIEDITKENEILKKKIDELTKKDKENKKIIEETNERSGSLNELAKKNANTIYAGAVQLFNGQNFSKALDEFILAEKYGINHEWIYAFIIQSAAYTKKFDVAEKYLKILSNKFPGTQTIKNCEYIINTQKNR